jgi:hypothetical protein
VFSVLWQECRCIRGVVRVLKIHLSKLYVITVIYFCCKKIICKVSFVMPCQTGYEAVLRRGFEPLQTLLEVVLVNGLKWQTEIKCEVWLSATNDVLLNANLNLIFPLQRNFPE